jgi:hypothetical protein
MNLINLKIKTSVVALIIIFSNIIVAEDIMAKVKKDVELFNDYQLEDKVGLIKKDEAVRIITQSDGHIEDHNYWGFDRNINGGSIRVQYKKMSGYINSAYLESIDVNTKDLLQKYYDKILVPEYYGKAVFSNNLDYIKKSDSFLKNYNHGIEYSFSTDLHKEWYYNYPVNVSYINDVYFQFTSKPYRYSISGFIKRSTKSTITCIVDSSFDQFNIYEGIKKYLPGNTYTFNYYFDGDYLLINDGTVNVFTGIWVNRNTWQNIYDFIKDPKIYYNDLDINKNDFQLPLHKNGKCDY